MKKNLVVAIAAIGLFFGAFTSNANAAYVQNGEFNNPWGGGSFTTYNAGGNFGGWNVDSGSVDLIGGYWQSATVGGGSVDMDGNRPGAISQTLTTGAGSYVLNFSLSGNPDAGTGIKGLRVSVGNVVQDFFYTITNANSRPNMNYLAQSLAFTATGPTTLTFASLTQGNSFFGAVVSGVSVSAVPLPAALPMFVMSLLGMFGFKKTRRQTQLA